MLCSSKASIHAREVVPLSINSTNHSIEQTNNNTASSTQPLEHPLTSPSIHLIRQTPIASGAQFICSPQEPTLHTKHLDLTSGVYEPKPTHIRPDIYSLLSLEPRFAGPFIEQIFTRSTPTTATSHATCLLASTRGKNYKTTPSLSLLGQHSSPESPPELRAFTFDTRFGGFIYMLTRASRTHM